MLSSILSKFAFERLESIDENFPREKLNSKDQIIFFVWEMTNIPFKYLTNTWTITLDNYFSMTSCTNLPSFSELYVYFIHMILLRIYITYKTLLSLNRLLTHLRCGLWPSLYTSNTTQTNLRKLSIQCPQHSSLPPSVMLCRKPSTTQHLQSTPNMYISTANMGYRICPRCRGS